MKLKGSNIKSTGFFGLIIAQFLGAFNDNAFKLVVSLYIMGIGTGMKSDTKLVSIAAAFFIVPFIIFSTYAGWLSDKFSKKLVIVKTKNYEVIVMTLGLLAFLSGNIVLIFSVLFLMGAQSAFFSPAKYAILPEIVRDEELSRANGILQMFTFLAIILGTAAGDSIFQSFKPGIHKGTIVFIAVAVIGAIASRFVQNVKPANQTKRLEMNPLSSALFTLRHLRKDKPLLVTILAVSFFWFIGALFQMNILVYWDSMVQHNQAPISIPLALIALGIAFGSFTAGRLSDGKIEFGLVPFGCLGMALFSYALASSYHSINLTLFYLFMLGISAGLYIVPLTAYVQQHSDASKKGENIAFNNLISFTAILFASLYLYVISNVFDVDPAGVFLTMSAAVIVVSLAIIKTIPTTFVRAFLWMFVRLRRKIYVTGRINIPKNSAALIVSNSTSLYDALYIAFSQQRPVKLVVPFNTYNNSRLKWLFKLLG
ncbi:MFS transporter, partial [Thermodesulfobacteriota bacterium]